MSCRLAMIGSHSTHAQASVRHLPNYISRLPRGLLAGRGRGNLSIFNAVFSRLLLRGKGVSRGRSGAAQGARTPAPAARSTPVHRGSETGGADTRENGSAGPRPTRETSREQKKIRRAPRRSWGRAASAGHGGGKRPTVYWSSPGRGVPSVTGISSRLPAQDRLEAALQAVDKIGALGLMRYELALCGIGRVGR